MSKAILLLAWIPFLIFPYHADTSTIQYVKVTCDHAWVLMDIVKNNDTILWKQKDHLLMDIREEVISDCNQRYP